MSITTCFTMSVLCSSGMVTEQPSVDTLVESLRVLERSCQQLGTSISMYRKIVRIKSDQDWGNVNWDDVEVRSSDALVWLRWDGQQRISRLATLNVDDSLKANIQSNSIYVDGVWDGEVWREWIKGGTGEPNVVRFEVAPSTPTTHETLALFNGAVEWPSFIGRGPLSETVLAIPLINAERTQEGEVYRFYTSKKTTRSQFIIAVSYKPQFRLRSVTLEIYGEPDTKFEDKVVLRKSVEFDDWRSYNDTEIPWKATMLAAIFFSPRMEAAGIDPIMNKVTIVRHDILGENDDFLPEHLKGPALVEGDNVHDGTLRLSYVIGSKIVVADRTKLRTKEPIRARITTDLPELIESELPDDM